MKNLCTLLFAVAVCAVSYSQSDCSGAIIARGNTQSFNPSGIGSKLEQLACGSIEHNSVWIAFQAKANGKLNFVIRPFTPDGLPSNSDFDWSLFALAGAPGTSNCDAKTQLSCNYAGAGTTFGIPGATGMATPNYASSQFNPGIDVVNGNWYVLIIDQFSNTTPLLFSVQFTGNPESPNLNSSPGIFDNAPNFTITNTSGCGGTYSFTNSSTAATGITSYLWKFGDGTTSAQANPVHTYVTPGTYYVTLTITDNDGYTSNIRKTLIYNNTPPALNAAGILITPSCTDGNNGTVTINTTGATTLGISGGSAPYTFELVSPSPMIRPSQSSNVFTGLQPGTYTIRATDACGKSATGTATVTQIATNSTITVGLQNVQAACNGVPSGTATLSANGSVPPYTFSLINSSPVLAAPVTGIQRDAVTATYFVTFTNLLPGTYTTEVTDGCGKIRRATFVVGASTAPGAGLVNSASCASSATGTINVTATAATGLSGNGCPGSFQYALVSPSPITRPFQSSSVFENLVPGVYTVAVKDACGNVNTANTTIATATAPTFAAAFTTLSCPNGSTGSIEAQINTVGGGSPFTFELVAPSPVIRAPQSSNLFSNLPPGAYVVKLTDACGTQVTSNVTVAAANAPTFTTTPVASCNGNSSGTITIAPGASSISPFTFELISPGAAIRPVQGSNIANSANSIFTGLNQGSYTVRMTDGCGVPVTNTATITAPTALAFPAGSVAVPSCASSSTGQITVAAPATGLGAYKYELIAPSPLVAGPQYSRIFNNLPAGDYTIRITDSCGSQATIGTPLTVGISTAPALTVTNTSSCAGNTGTITCIGTAANQGGGLYQFALIAPSPETRSNQSSPIFTGLPAGNYTVQITDQCGATGTTTTTIAAAGAFTPAASGGVVACNGSGYYSQIIVTNPANFTAGGPIPPGSGGGPYTYALYDAANTVLIAGPQASNSFSGVTPVAGSPSHTVRVTDACGNTSIVAVAINPPAALTSPNITATTLSCGSSNTGIIKLSGAATGGLAPYQYTLIDAVTTATVAGPQTATTFNNVPVNATGYLVRSTDACGNTVTSATPLLYPAAATPTATVATVASCASGATGRITVTPGTGSTLAGGTFSYSLYDAANTTLLVGSQSSPVFSGLAPATYTVRLTDRCGTTGTVSATVTSTVTALTSAGTATGTCTGSNNGVITGSSTGGSLPITYTLIDQPTGTTVAGPQAGNIFTGLAAGTYTVRVTDACGTITNSTDVVLGNLSTSPTITTTSAIDCSGSAIIAGYGGSGNGGPYTYAICSGTGCSGFGSFAATSTFQVSSSGTYRISAQDRCGNAVASADLAISIPVKPAVTNIVNTNPMGSTTITPSFTGVPNTAYYSVDGSNFSAALGSYDPACHTLRVADYNSGTFGCASDAYNFSVLGVPSLNTPAPGDINCSSRSIVINTTPLTGSAGCTGSNAALGIKLVSCTGCTALADPIGTIKDGPAATFNLPGSTEASFVPVIRVSGVETASGSTSMDLNFMLAPYVCSSTLPVNLLTFSGKKEGTVNKLTWITTNEQYNAGFEIQRSTDGVTYTTIGFVASVATGGNSTGNIEYAFTDNLPAGDRQYYRLKQIDIDGKSKLSSVIILKGNIHPLALAIEALFPNPAMAEVNLLVASPVREQATLTITDLFGRKITEKMVTIETGSNTIQLTVTGITSGTYFVKLVSKSSHDPVVAKFIKQ